MMATQSRRELTSGGLVPGDEGSAVAGEVVGSDVELSDVDWQRGLAEQLLARAQADGVSLVGPDGLLAGITKAVLERALAVELSVHLGYEKGDPAGVGAANVRNGFVSAHVFPQL